MKFILKRTSYRADGIFGILLGENGRVICSTLEHAYANTEIIGCSISKIPYGTYQCTLGSHKLTHGTRSFMTYQLQNVPGHTNILIHPGCFNADSEGCILLGTGIGQDIHGWWRLVNSQIAFASFLKLTAGLDTIELNISQ